MSEIQKARALLGCPFPEEAASEPRDKPGPTPLLEGGTRLTVTLDAAMAARILGLAERRKITQSEVVRRLLRKALR